MLEQEKEALINVKNTFNSIYNYKTIDKLKQSRQHTPFIMVLNKLHATIKDGIDNYKKTSIIDFKQTIQQELEELNTVCDTTTKVDNALLLKNIGNFVKHTFKTIIDINNKSKMFNYGNAILYANKNTNLAKDDIKYAIENIQYTLKDIMKPIRKAPPIPSQKATNHFLER